MRISATIKGQQYVLDYAKNGSNEVSHVTIMYDGILDVTDDAPFLIKAIAWVLAANHNATHHPLVAEHAPTPAVPAIPAQVAVPHVFESSPKKHAAEALNADAMLIAMHALHVEAIAQSSNHTTTSALNKAYVAMKREAGQAFAHAKLAGGLLFAFHGSKAFEVAA